MGFGTEIERNDFKTVVEMFTKQIRNIPQEIEDSV